MRCALLWTHLPLLLILILDSTDLTSSRSCPDRCGRVLIPYPFGIGKGCYLDEWFEIQCTNSTSGDPVPYLPKISKEVVHIQLPSLSVSSSYVGDEIPKATLRIKANITSRGCSNNFAERTFGNPLNFTDSPFTISDTNTLVAVGCNNKAMLTNLDPRLIGCISSCEQIREGSALDCNGYRCCQANMPDNYGKVIGVSIEEPFNNNKTIERECRVAFITDVRLNDIPEVNLNDPRWFYDSHHYVTLGLQWVVPVMHLSYINSLRCHHSKTFKSPCGCDNFTNFDSGDMSCKCNRGFTGNPYVLDGCKDIDECKIYKCSGSATCVNTIGDYHCVFKKNKTLPIAIGFSVGFGVLILIGASFWLYKFIKRRRKINMKKKFFKRNGGLLLEQQLTSTKASIEKTKVFNSKELEKATENFSLNRVLGQGGQGTVYKGMLIDGRIVAIKKSKVVDEDKLEEFINEVVILSQINHRNIVKLLGCCLETQVPLLVYEFIPNGNLFEHLHDDSDDYTMATWEVRLCMAIDIAGALSYLHSAASCPIYHRDVKTTNIMLDEKYRAKVSDFGTSRSVTVDHTHLTTVVSGTAGYMDPEYFQSSQFTDKSDVYSFGVVLVELITGEKPISFFRSQENRTLATYFILAVKENRVADLIDPRIKNDCKLEQVMAAATVARRCLNLNGKKRPSMREVSMELERIRSPKRDAQSPAHAFENNVALEFNIDIESYNNVGGFTAPSTVFQDNVGSTSWLDAEPLFPRQTI